jgi:hypothetical protein
MNLSDNPNYAIIKEWLDLRHLSQTLLLESMAALTAAIDNPNQEMVDEAKRKVAELNLITAELRELHTKRDN